MLAELEHGAIAARAWIAGAGAVCVEGNVLHGSSVNCTASRDLNNLDATCISLRKMGDQSRRLEATLTSPMLAHRIRLRTQARGKKKPVDHPSLAQRGKKNAR